MVEFGIKIRFENKGTFASYIVTFQKIEVKYKFVNCRAVCVNMELSNKIMEIESDRTNGASQISRNALSVLHFFVCASKHNVYKSFVDDFSDVGKRLFEARVNMASIQNLMAQIVYEVNTLDENNVDVVRKFALSRIDDLCKQSKNAVKESARLAATSIDDCACIVTCSYSSTVCESLKVAKLQGKSFEVFVAESKTDRYHYGQVLVDFLESINVTVEIFPDKLIKKYITKANCALVGADSILCDGSVINGTPTNEVAVSAKECGIPFYSVCETSKLNTLSFLGKKVELKKGFDVTPPNQVTGIITEKGILNTYHIIEIMEEHSKFFGLFFEK
jgi:translation initiation factor 2B subunit (eIF-2B alpha/beta/delta family)